MSDGRPGLTPYQVAYLAGGPRRVAETAAVELLRRGRLSIGPSGRLTPARAGSGAVPGPHAADDADQRLEQLILSRAADGPDLAELRRRCGRWQPVRQIGSAQAAAGLAFSRRHRRVALLLALILIAAWTAAAVAFARGWQVAPTARSPLGLAAAVVAAGLLARACRRTTGAGRRRLQDTASRIQDMLVRLQPAAAGQRLAVTRQEVADVALAGLGAVRDAELRTRLGGWTARDQSAQAAGGPPAGGAAAARAPGTSGGGR